MQIEDFFANLAGIAVSFERIATALERIADKSEEDYDAPAVVATAAPASVAAAPAADKPRRGRPRKADTVGAAAETAGGITNPLSGQAVPPLTPPPAAPTPPVVPMPVPTAPTVPASVAPVQTAGAQPPAAPFAAPPSPASIAATSSEPLDILAGYTAMPVEGQFVKLNELVIPHFNVPAVRDTLVNTASAFGISLPFSNPMDRSMPGDNYRSLSNDARFTIYAQVAKIIAQIKAGLLPQSAPSGL